MIRTVTLPAASAKIKRHGLFSVATENHAATLMKTKKSDATRPVPKSRPKNAFYAQSGGVTAVINASACGVIETAAKYPKHIGKVYAGKDGIVGALTEQLIDTSRESRETIKGLRYTPAGAFGSARFKLKGLDKNRAEYERLIEVFRAHDIGYFFYNGGNDSMDTAMYFATEPKPGQQSVCGRSLSTVFGTPTQVMG